MSYFISDARSFAALVTPGTTQESKYLEFKRQVHLGKQPANNKRNLMEFCRDVSQFANGEGGCLVIGVSEQKATGRPTFAGEIVGVGDVNTLLQQAEQALTRYLVPSTFQRRLIPIALENSISVLAINIPASERPVVVWDAETGATQCYCRDDFGKRALNPAEFEELLMNSNRGMRLRLGRLHGQNPSQPVIIHSNVRGPGQGGLPHTAVISHLGENEFALTITCTIHPGNLTGTINVPYEFISVVWRNARQEVTIELTRAILLSSGNFAIEGPGRATG